MNWSKNGFKNNQVCSKQETCCSLMGCEVSGLQLHLVSLWSEEAEAVLAEQPMCVGSTEQLPGSELSASLWLSALSFCFLLEVL